MNIIVYICIILQLVQLILASDNDFYNLLGIEKSSDARSIRKAFKQLALKLHPDKNPGDEKAHEQFLAINRAYEVLKDDDLRRIYDEFGESGLKQHETGRGREQRYQSWSYYNEYFGIYDNDDDIITLSRSDFEQSVKEQRRETIFFVNFFSPRCSHCHTLAPEWRKLAKSLRNVIRIGAVNCAEDRELCQTEGIHSYPSLILYPYGKKFDSSKEPRDSEHLIRFVLKNLNIKVKRFNDVNMKDLLSELSSHEEVASDKSAKKDKNKRTSWYLIAACHKRKYCLPESQLSLLTYKLSGIAQIAEILCDSENHKICDQFRLHENKLVLYEDLANNPNTYYEIDDLKPEAEFNEVEPEVETDVGTEVEEIFNKVLNKFPIVETLNDADKAFLDDCLFGEKNAPCEERLTFGWILAMFRDKEQAKSYEIEMKLLFHFMPQHPILYTLCEDDESSRKFCSKFESNNVKKYPRINTIKYVSTGSYEKYYGRFNAIDILNFALDSFESRLRILNPKEFEETIVKDKVNAHLVQFFSPRCPACKVAQQKLRKLSQYPFPRSVTFGVIDCGVYSDLCRRYNIQSYPTVLLYNDTTPHQYVGKFAHDQPIIDFISYTLKSDLVEIDPQFFETEIQSSIGSKKSEVWIVSFSSPFCYICQVLSPTLRKLATILTRDEPEVVKIASINCNRFRSFCAEQQINNYPTIRLYPSRKDPKHNSSFYTFKNRRDFDMLRAWFYDFLPNSRVEELEDSQDFDEAISQNQPTVIDFYSPWAFSSRRFQPEFNRLSRNFPEAQFRRVNCERLAKLCDELQVHFYPSLRFYSANKNLPMDRHYRKGIHIQLPDLDSIDEFDLNDLTEKIRTFSDEQIKDSHAIKTEL